MFAPSVTKRANGSFPQANPVGLLPLEPPANISTFCPLVGAVGTMNWELTKTHPLSHLSYATYSQMLGILATLNRVGRTLTDSVFSRYTSGSLFICIQYLTAYSLRWEIVNSRDTLPM